MANSLTTSVFLQRDIPLDSDLLSQLEKYEILVVPGGPGSRALAQASQVESPFMKSISTFAQLASASSPGGDESGQSSRVLLYNTFPLNVPRSLFQFSSRR